MSHNHAQKTAMLADELMQLAVDRLRQGHSYVCFNVFRDLLETQLCLEDPSVLQPQGV
jgi:hypothetical protein